jgi:ATP-dependent Clp protease ATP-binding subunit ClpC
MYLDDDPRKPPMTLRAQMVLQLAESEARDLGHDYVGPEHMLLGLIREHDGLAAQALDSFGIALYDARNVVEWFVGRGDASATPVVGSSRAAADLVTSSMNIARQLNHQYASTEHLLLAIIQDDRGIVARILDSFGIRTDLLADRVMQLTIGPDGQ